MRLETRLSPITRLPPRTGFDNYIALGARIATIAMGAVALIAALSFGRALLVPLTLALVIGMMLGPYADRLERQRLAPSVSALLVVLVFLLAIAGCGLAFAVPLSGWINRLPEIWSRIRDILVDWRGIIEAANAMGEQLKSITGDAGNMKVTVEDGGPTTDLAFLAPGLIAQLLIFLACLYFFLANRHDIRASILRLCIDRRLRWRVAHVFKDAEVLVSHYLVSITIINLGLGVAVSIAMFLIGVPSPLLWGLMAAVLNYIVYIGPAFMAVILLGVGLATFSTFPAVIVPVAVYLALNLTEAQFATPHVLGRRLVVNPLIVFLALVFWLWLWGPAGGFVAVPLLLIAQAITWNILPVGPNRPARQARVGT